MMDSKNLESLEDDFKVTFKIESFESIHPHNVYSEHTTTIGDLKRAVRLQ